MNRFSIWKNCLSQTYYWLLEEEKCFYKGTLVEAKTSIAKTICQNTFQKYFNESNANDYFNTIDYKKDLLLVFQKAHQLL